MANLEQCLRLNSVQPPRQRRRRRKRNKGKKAVKPLNNSIIHEYAWQPSSTGLDVNTNFFRFDTPGESTIQLTTKKSAVNQTIDLCSDDSSNETLNCTYFGDSKPSVNSQPNENLIDLSKDVPDENDIIILLNDESQTPENNCPHITPCEPKTTENGYPPITPLENKCPNNNTPHDNKSSESKNPLETRPLEPRHPPIIPLANKSPESKCPNNTSHENKPPDTQSSNSIFPNVTSPDPRPPKSVLLHSRPENKSPLSKPSDTKYRRITPPEPEQPDDKPANSNKCETVIIDLSDDGNEGDLNLSEKHDTNDEILVIGTFHKTSRSNVVLQKKIGKKSNKNRNKQIYKENLRDPLTERYCSKAVSKPQSKAHPKDLFKPQSKAQPKENPRQGSHTNVREQGGLDYAESSNENSKAAIAKIERKIRSKYCKKFLQYKKKMQVNLFDTIKYQHLLINNRKSGTELSKGVGGNVYINAPVYIPTSGLRPIMIDGSNVAFTSENEYKFSCKRLDTCIKYFKEKGHKVTAFVPQFRVQSNQSDNPGLLDRLVRSGDVVLTPSKVIDGKLIVPYDDRFIVQAAVLKGGVIISRDNYKDLLEENPTWAETIKYRTLAYTWVDDVLMFPSDPLGVVGPTLEQFLRFS